MITKIFEIITKTGKAEKDLKKLTSEVDNVNTGLETTNKEAKKTSRLGKAFGIAKKGAKGLAGGFRMIGTALNAAGIGLIVSLFLALKSALEQNQKAMDALAVVTETISIAFSEVAKVLKEVYDNVSKASENFDALGKVMGGILTLVITPFKLGFQGIKAAIVGAQLAWEDSFLGGKDPEKIKELKAELDEIKGDVVEIGTEALEAGKSIVENAGEALSEVADIGSQVIDGLKEISVEAVIENAKANVELKKSAELAAVANQGLIEKYDLQAESLRQLRDDERNSIEDRKKANDELAIVLDQQEKAMLSNAKISLRAAKAELKKDKNNIEFKKAVMEAENELAAVRAQVAGFRSEQQANDLALSREELEMANSKLEAENNLSIERKRFNAEQIEDDLARLQKQKEIDAEEKEIQTIRLQGIIDAANAGTQAKIDAEIALNEFLEQSRQQEITREKEIGQAKLAATQKNNDEILASDEAVTAARISLEEALVNATSSSLQSIAQLAGEGTKIAKVAAIADIIIGTGVGFINGLEIAQKSAKATGPGAAVAFPIFYATQVAAVLSAAAQAKNVLSKAKGPSAPTISAPSGGGGASATQAPSFNVVGQSGFNQIAGALGQQPPTQAFVVAGDVTTAQQLANNTIQQATF